MYVTAALFNTITSRKNIVRMPTSRSTDVGVSRKWELSIQNSHQSQAPALLPPEDVWQTVSPFYLRHCSAAMRIKSCFCIRVAVSQVEELELEQTSNVGHYDVYTLLLLLLRPYTSKVIVQILVTKKEGKKRKKKKRMLSQYTHWTDIIGTMTIQQGLWLSNESTCLSPPSNSS